MDPRTDMIYNRSTDPFFNLAAEQYLLDRADPRPVFMLWRNFDTVVIGRNQNAYAEINEPFARGHGISVVRRLTGGGAVFHDEGNVNYTFIVPEGDARALDFAHFTAPVIDALRALGADARLSGRNDICVGDKKVSGNAQCVRNGRIMHHGTLLWSSDAAKMAGALRVNEKKMESKGIKSVRSRVANLRDLLDSEMSTEGFIDYLFGYMGSAPRGFTGPETAAITDLRDAKYATWEWNWGESRSLNAVRGGYFPFGSVEIRFDAERGVLKEVSITGDFFGTDDLAVLESRLKGVRLEPDALRRALDGVDAFISGARAEDIASLILDPS